MLCRGTSEPFAVILKLLGCKLLRVLACKNHSFLELEDISLSITNAGLQIKVLGPPWEIYL